VTTISRSAVRLVVVVEDDAASRRTLGRVLRAGGFEPVMYESAEDYLASPPDHDPLGMLVDSCGGKDPLSRSLS
jgi:FixJ family two-component response regulator